MKIHHKGDAAARRKGDYPPIGDQIDALWKIVEHLERQGVDLPPDGVAMLAKVRFVKNRYPKKNGS